MIDFTKCEVNKFKAYGGANGNKINIRYGGKEYMLKKVVVACRDFTENGKKLMEFAQLKNTCIDSEQFSMELLLKQEFLNGE